MNTVIAKTFGGLSKSYYFRQFFFGFIFLAIIFLSLNHGKNTASISIGTYAFFIMSTILYPYSRFVYESIVNFIMGNNVIFGNAIFMMIFKLFTMAICWSAAIFISPIGLAYLYYQNRNTAQ